MVSQVATDWRKAALAPVDRELCAFAERLTGDPAAMSEADLGPLRELGLDDRGIHDAVQVISYFNYINRVADALGLEPESFIHAWEDGDLPERS